MARNIAVRLSAVAKYLDAHKNPGNYTVGQQTEIAQNLHKALVAAKVKLDGGFEDPNLTVCQGRGGYCDPEDFQRLLSDEIPRMTVYRAPSSKHTQRIYYKHPPKFYKGKKPCKTRKPSTPKPATERTRSSVKPTK